MKNVECIISSQLYKESNKRSKNKSIFRECCSTISDFQLIFSASHSWYDPYLYPFSNHVADKKGAKGIYLTWIKYENPNEPDLIVWYHWFQSNYNSWSSFRYFSFFICSSKKASEHQNDHVTVYSRNKVGKSSTVFFSKIT